MRARRAVLATVLVALSCGVGMPAATHAQSAWDDLSSRTTLAENWGGVRNDAQAKGFTIDASITLLAQGVVSGGARRSIPRWCSAPG